MHNLSNNWYIGEVITNNTHANMHAKKIKSLMQQQQQEQETQVHGHTCILHRQASVVYVCRCVHTWVIILPPRGPARLQFKQALAMAAGHTHTDRQANCIARICRPAIHKCTPHTNILGLGDWLCYSLSSSPCWTGGCGRSVDWLV